MSDANACTSSSGTRVEIAAPATPPDVANTLECWKDVGDPADLRLKNLETEGAVTANWLRLGTIALEHRQPVAALPGADLGQRQDLLAPGNGGQAGQRQRHRRHQAGAPVGGSPVAVSLHRHGAGSLPSCLHVFGQPSIRRVE